MLILVEETDILFSTALAFHEPKALPNAVRVKEEGCFDAEDNIFLWIHPNCIVCDFYAYKSLNCYLKECGFWSELLLGDNTIFLFTVTKELFTLNESEFVEVDGFRLDVKKYCFNEFDECQYPIFLLGNVKGHYPLVSEFFVNKVRELGIKGMRFDLISD